MRNFVVDIKFNVDTGELEAAQQILNGLVESADRADDTLIKPEVDTGEIEGAGQSMDDFGSKSEEAAGKASRSFSGLGGVLAQVAGAIGFASLATAAWEGATEKQTNQLLLARKYGTGAAQDISNAISAAVSKTPGDDAFLTSMLSNASLQAKMTKKDIEDMASAIADYQTMSKASGSNTFEAQGEIRNYLMTGETGRMKDTPLSAYMDQLEGASTVTERVNALNKAMEQLGYSGASGMSSAANSMETLKGTFQNALSEMGMAGLPVIQGLADGFLSLDQKTGGWLSKLTVGGAGALAGLATAGKPAFDTLNSVSQSAHNIKDGIDTAKGAMSAAKGVIDTLRGAESLRAGVVAVLAGAQGVETLEEAANAAAKSAGIGPTIALAIANNTLLLPILLVTAAVIAIIAILWYLYNTNDTVRNGINQLIAVFRLVGNVILGTVLGAINSVINGFNRVKSIVGSVASAVSGTLTSAWNSFKSSVSNALSPLTSVYNKLQSLYSLAQQAGSAISNAFSGIGFAGFAGFEGFAGNSLNKTISNNASNSQNLVIHNENNFNGIIENDAKEYIVNSMNEVLTRENLKRGVV